MTLLFYLWLVGFCGMALGQASPTTTVLCDNVADIVFILDSSGSIGQYDFNKQLNFVAKITQNFELGPTKFQFGALLFSDYVYKLFFLDTYQSHANLTKAIRAATYEAGHTWTDRAVDYTRNQMFNPAHGARANVTKIAVILTDGGPTDANLAHISYKKLKDTGVLIVAIGVANVHRRELNLMASSLDEVFYAPSFDALQHIQQAVSNKTCELPEEKPCPHTADIIFVLDSSGSINSVDRNNYNRELQFVERVTSKFQIGPVRFGAVIFSQNAEKQFDLKTYGDQSKLSAAIRRIKYLGSRTFTAKGLKMVENGMFDPAQGGRDDAANIIILMTDGQPEDRVDAHNEAARLKSKGASIIAIGVGTQPQRAELEIMASTKNDVYMVDDFHALQHIIDAVSHTACSAAG